MSEKIRTKKNKLGVEEGWTKIIKNIKKNYNTIAKQYDEAKKQYPELTATYINLIGYITFLTRRLQMLELRHRSGGNPTLEPPVYPNLSEDICDINPEDPECLCTGGIHEECPPIDGGPDVHIFMTCNDLKEELGDILRRICIIYQNNTDGYNLSQKEFTSLRKLMNLLKKVMTELVEKGCFELEFIIEPVTRIFPGLAI